jgi:sugar O-acyltransferase (sialic acid O-acetyltransferase NeuD family)
MPSTPICIEIHNKGDIAKMKKVVLYGETILRKMLFYDGLGRNDFQIACFCVDRDYWKDNTFLGLPLISFEDVESMYPPKEYDMIALMAGYTGMRIRNSMYLKAKEKGYTMRNYISPKADITPEVTLGENNIILGHTHIGLAGMMGNNNLIRQNVYLGHDFNLGNNIVITAGCNIGGNSVIKDNCYIGLGSTIKNNITLEEETLVGAGSVVIRNSEPYSTNVGNPSRVIGYHKEEGIRMSV